MTTLQFSLFLAGLLVCYLLVHLRLLKFENHLAQLDHLDTVRRAMLHVAKQLDAANAARAGNEGGSPAGSTAEFSTLNRTLDEVGSRLGAIADKLETLTERLDVELDRPAAAPVVLPGPESSPADRLRATVETRLLALGYGRVRILTDLDSEGPLDRERELAVECERGGMPHKGRVTTRNGSVLDVQLQSVAQAFP